MKQFRAIAWPAYSIAALLVLFPLVDFFFTILPLRPGDVTWRFGAVGLFSRALLTPLLGLLLVFLTAVLLEQWRVLRGVAVLSGVAVVAVLGTLAFFVLDSLQMRAQVRPDITSSFDIATIAAMAKYGAVSAALMAMAIPGWRHSRKPRSAARSPEAGKSDLVLGGRTARPTREIAEGVSER